MEITVSFNILLLIPSGPDAFDVSRLFKISKVSVIVILMVDNLALILSITSGRCASEVSIVANFKNDLLNSSALV